MDVADAGEAALKSFAALGPVAAFVGGVVAALGVAYMAYAREQDQAKESAEQMEQAFIALDSAQRTLEMSLIDLGLSTGKLTELGAKEATIQATLEQKMQDLARAAYKENEEKKKQIASNMKWRDTIMMATSPLMLFSEGILMAVKAGTHLAEMFGVSEEYGQQFRKELDAQFEAVQKNFGLFGKLADSVFGWSDEIEHAKDSIDATNKSTEEQTAVLVANADAQTKTAQALARTAAAEKAKAEADKAAAEAERELVKTGAEINKQATERNKLLADTQAVTEALTASVEGFYEPAIEGEDQYAKLIQETQKAIRETQDEYDKLRKKIHKQIAANLEAGESIEELTALEIQLTQEKADKVSAINKEQADKKAKLDKEAAEKELSTSEMIARKIINIRKKQGKEVSETAEEEKASQLEAAGEVLGAVVAGISEIGQAMQGYLSETTDALNEIDELQADLNGKEIDASQLKGEALVEAYKNGEIAAEDLSKSQKQFIGNVLKADEEALKKKEKRQRAAAMAGFVTDKAAAISAVVINTAEAVTKALAKLGPVAGGVAAGALITIAGAQTALIAAEKPSFASGVANYRPDAVDATLHTGESVLNTRATRMLGEDQVNQLNQGRSMGGPTDITSSIFLNDRLFEAQSVKARMKYGTEMNKASRKNRIGISSKRRG